MKNFSDIGIQIPQVYLPRDGTDLQKWAVIACDQFTSEPQYWADVKQFVGSAPSTLKLTFPEVYLDQGGATERITAIGQAMNSYLQSGILEPHEGLIYVERSAVSYTHLTLPTNREV